jgi:tRNA-i(6)A37 thiotransferase enzyme MiaB
VRFMKEKIWKCW